MSTGPAFSFISPGNTIGKCLVLCHSPAAHLCLLVSAECLIGEELLCGSVGVHLPWVLQLGNNIVTEGFIPQF